MVSLAVKVGKLEIPNPTILASGILGISAKLLLRVLDNGAGAVVTKSFGLSPKKGYGNPTIYEMPYGLLNAMGLPNPGVEFFSEELKKVRGKNVIASIFGSEVEEYMSIIKKVEDFVVGFELNFSCPHAKGYGIEVGRDTELVEEILKEVRKATQKPIWAKISLEIPNFVELGKIAEKYADAIVMTNTLKGMAIDIHAKRPVLTAKIGGYSGPSIKPLALRGVYELYENVKADIVGCGGILSGYDAVEFFMAGAKAVEIGSGIYYRGIGIFREISREIKEFMEREGYDKIEDMVGVAHV